MPAPKPRSVVLSGPERSRSNSLQRMLDLEKLYLQARMQAIEVANDEAIRRPRPAPLSIKSNTTPSHIDVVPPNLSVSTPVTPGTNTMSCSSHTSQQPSPKQHSFSSEGSMPPRLQLDLQSHQPFSIDSVTYDDVFGKTQLSSTTRGTGRQSSLPSSKENPSPCDPKTPETPQTPINKLDRQEARSTCQSPTWEAYDRRKQDKKKEKEARRVKQQMAGEARSQKRRLITKPPPTVTKHITTSAYSIPYSAFNEPPLKQNDGCVSDSETTAGSWRRKQRPVSALGLSALSQSTSADSVTPRPPRTRAGSFSSLARAIERRRPSVEEQRPEIGFIGGIKLETQQRVEQQQAEADIHPALRKSRPDLGIPPHFETPRHPTPRGESSGKKDRAYPPITRHPAMPKGSVVSSPPVSSPPDTGMFDRLRARVGFRSHSVKEENGAQTPVQSILSEKNHDQFQGNKPSMHPERIGNKHQCVKDTSKAMAELPGDSSAVAARGSTAIDGNSIRLSGGGSPLSLPPAPPRRSSKRSSSASRQSHASPSSIQYSPAASIVDLPESSALSGSNVAVIGPKSTKQAQLFKSAKVSSKQGEPRASQWAGFSGRPQTSSSEDSSSDAFHSLSPLSTPGTSRPQSEKCLTPPLGDAERHSSLDANHHQACQPSAKSPLGPSMTSFEANDHPGFHDSDNESEDDPIEAAARKVMAAFPELANTRRDGYDTMRNLSESGLGQRSTQRKPREPKSKLGGGSELKDAGVSVQILPAEDEPAVTPIRELMLMKDQASSTSPWPATYLEATRKAGPARPSKGVDKEMVSPKEPPVSAARAFLPPSMNNSRHSVTLASMKQPESEPQPIAPKRSSNSKHTETNASSDGIAKMFVECCGCRYYHDMPSKLYEAMAHPEGVVGGLDGDTLGLESDAISMTVKCPWCKHEMSTRCCAGLAAMVYVKERLH
jgi:hypothetical protein